MKVLTTTAFANAAAAAVKKPGAPKAEDRVAPQFTEIVNNIPVPAAAKRGSKSVLAEKLAALANVNDSIGLTNKTKKQISSTLSKVNNAASNLRQKLDANGAPVVKQGAPLKDANGAIVGHGAPVPEMERVKEFEAYDVDPKSDPQKATVRIFRIK